MKTIFIFLYLTGSLLRFPLIKYCNIDVFHYYISLYSNLYYLAMVILSIPVIEKFQFMSNWSDVFECVKVFIKHCLKSKIILMDHSSRSYKDTNSIGRKNVCPMNNIGSSSVLDGGKKS